MVFCIGFLANHISADLLQVRRPISLPAKRGSRSVSATPATTAIRLLQLSLRRQSIRLGLLMAEAGLPLSDRDDTLHSRTPASGLECPLDPWSNSHHKRPRTAA